MYYIGYFPEARNLEAVFSRGPKLEYKRQQQARRFSLSREILSEALFTVLVCTVCFIFNEIFYFKWLFGHNLKQKYIDLFL